MSNEELTAWAVVSDDPDREPHVDIGSFYGCVTAGQWIAGVTAPADWLASGPFWVDTILLGHERFEIRPRVHVSPGCTAWFDLRDWPGTIHEKRRPLNPEAFTEHVLSRPLDWLRDDARQDMRRILGVAD